jgi:glycosyltransferase involved in cell wall biosynthesis
LQTLSVVIPALNEAANIEDVIASVPVTQLYALGWSTQILVVDNASTDGTGELAAAAGADVVLQPIRGYGSAYKAGFAAATGSMIVTGDADRTYPLDHIPDLLHHFEHHRLDFLTTNRLLGVDRRAMKRSHSVGNHVLSAVSRRLFRNGIYDSQSGMWMFRTAIWHAMDVRSNGMAFSQELKNEANRRGFRCGEVPIVYRPRGGDVKLNAARDGWHNLQQLFEHRRRPMAHRTPAAALPTTAPIPLPAAQHEAHIRLVMPAHEFDAAAWDDALTGASARYPYA